MDVLPGGGSGSAPSDDHRTAQRSRRGKYPVVELWRRDTADDGSLDDKPSCEQVDDELSGERPAAARGTQTALGHLRAVLALGTEQVDAVQESFPALAEVHPDKLDLRAKLVS